MARRIRIALLALAVALGMLIAAGAASAQILPPGSTVHGKTIGEWTQDWWNWYFSIPAAIEPYGDEPLTDATGEHATDGQSCPVFFLNGVFGPTASGPVTRIFEVPACAHLLVNLLSFVWVASAGELCEEIAPIVEGAVDGIDGLFLRIDGVPVTQAEISSHREATGCFTAIVPVEGNPSHEPVGIYPGSYGSGYWVMIGPLTPGPHVIEAGGAHSGFGIDVGVITNNINVPLIPALLPPGLCLLGALLLATGWLALRRRPA